MRLFEVKPLYEATFTPRNFPEEGNEDFSGAGERTNYIEDERNEKEGFKLTKDIRVVKKDGRRVDLEQGTRVHITRPGRLVRGSKIDASPASGVFTLISKKSPKAKDALGYALISSIEKPSAVQQSRITTGAGSQEAIAQELEKEYGADYEFVSTAKKGSTVADLVVKIGGEEVQFEIKGTSSPTAPITFFDKSVRRSTQVEFLDEFAETFSKGKAASFVELVDQYREEDPLIGFPGDEGTGKSGKLPKDFQIKDDPQLLSDLRENILEHFAEGGDNYFAVHNRTSDEVDIYHTGFGPNPLKADPLPELKEFKLSTYGGPSAGAMRVGVKIKLK